MKNKALTYILLIVVAGIWYQVFFRVKGNLFGDNEIIDQSSDQRISLSNLHRDTVKLNLNYRDPFGKTKRIIEPVLEKKGPKSRGVAKLRDKPKPKFVWPEMIYYGMVKKTNSNRPLAVIKVDGVQLMLRQGEEVFDGIFLRKIERDVITLNYKRQTKEVWR